MDILDEFQDDWLLSLREPEPVDPMLNISPSSIAAPSIVNEPILLPSVIPKAAACDLLKKSEADLTEFNRAMAEPTLTINPRKLGFIPDSIWQDEEVPFNRIVKDFFQRKNSATCRFIHKLYNAQRLTEHDPSFIPIVGVSWVSDKILKINRAVFAKLLMIKAVEGSLFNKQGNFPSHGFDEVEPGITRSMFPDFDFSLERLMIHREDHFVRGCSKNDVLLCKWNH